MESSTLTSQVSLPTHRTTVVVGAGSSGAVVASRLSELSSERVILIEAGPDFATTEQLPEHLRDAEHPSLHGHDWEHTCEFVEPAGARDVGRYPRGRVLGGTSAVNAALALRGIPEDFDEWAMLGNHEWAWEAVLPFFVKLESDADFGDKPYHGVSGPVPVWRDPIESWPAALQAMAGGFGRHGIDFVDDHNAPGAAGFGPTPRNKIGQFRASSSVTYLQAARQRPNLEVIADTLVTRVLVHDGRATGVEVQQNGSSSTISANRVVLCGGAINSPQILMLSGIGPKGVLDRAGVEVVTDLPGVGRNLQDHPFVPMVFEATRPDEDRYGFRAHLRYSSELAGCPPNDIYMTPGFISTKSMNFETRPGVSAAVMANPTLAKPESEGWLEITSSDPSAHPEVHLNFLGTEADRARMLAAVRFAFDVLMAEPVRREIGDTVVAPPAEVVSDDELLMDWMLRHVSTAFHAAGTCRMGPWDDDLAVLDQRLRVRGIADLYVGDASIMPRITTGFTNLPCYMIGERLAAWLSEDA